eukprot:5478999-Lingulodinium_polyedra.AAC.1
MLRKGPRCCSKSVKAGGPAGGACERRAGGSGGAAALAGVGTATPLAGPTGSSWRLPSLSDEDQAASTP